MARDEAANRESRDIYESERQTRKQRIDPKLRASGWSVVPFVSEGAATSLANSAIEEYETRLGPADYIFADDGDLLGVVEAKKLTLGPQGVLPQAERYAKAVPTDAPYQGEFGVPFLYSTNGEEIWFHDVRDPMNRSRKVSAFHTPKALREMLEREYEAGPLAASNGEGREPACPGIRSIH
jgi:type I restriction enzyme R subunit